MNLLPADADEGLLQLGLRERAVAAPVLLAVVGAVVHVVHALLQPVHVVEGVVRRLLHEYVSWKKRVLNEGGKTLSFE